MKSTFPLILAALLITSFLPACATAPKTQEQRAELRTASIAAAERARRKNPAIQPILNQALAYAVFPTIGKGAAGIGAAHGRGMLFEKNQPVAYCDMQQLSLGIQLGLQIYTEIICFNSPQALEQFKEGKLALGAQASIVALDAGSGTNADYTRGVLIFTLNESGAMFEASMGAQKFSCRPL